MKKKKKRKKKFLKKVTETQKCKMPGKNFKKILLKIYSSWLGSKENSDF